MAFPRFSGQYAAAQLGKLQLPCAVLLEISDYIDHRDLDLLVPPTYFTFARMLGRLPADTSMERLGGLDFQVFDYELPNNYRGAVSATSVSLSGIRLVRTYSRGTLELIRAEVAVCILYDVDVATANTPEDFEFFARWGEQYGHIWPRVPGHVIHHKLLSPVERFRSFLAKHQEHVRFAETIRRRYNSIMPAVRAFGLGGADSDSDAS